MVSFHLVLLHCWVAKQSHFPLNIWTSHLAISRYLLILIGVILLIASKKTQPFEKIILSPTNMLIFIKTTISSLPFYFMSMYAMPIHVWKKIEGIIALFLQSEKSNGKSLVKVTLKNVCALFYYGGLGVSPLKVHNEGLLLKQIWKLRNFSFSNLQF